jgi:putative selenate reductase molybdopterin-binding subunit
MSRHTEERHASGGTTVRSRSVSAKAAGRVEFLTDLSIPGCLWGAAIRSPHPRAKAVDIDTASLLAMDGVEAVYTWADVPDTQFNPALTPPDEVTGATRDKRMLTRLARHVGDEVAVVVADTRAQARRAAAKADVVWAVAEPVLTIEDALACGRVVGSFQSGSERARHLGASADIAVGHRFDFAAAQHSCLETSTCAAVPASDGTAVEIWTNSQCPAEVRRQVAAILSIDESAVRVRKVDEGGGFGAKQELYDEPLAAWLALRLGRPVRFARTRAEEMTAGRVRAAGHIDLTLGFDRSGMLLASEMTAVLDCGGYVSHTPYVLSCMPGHLIAVYPRAAHWFAGTLVTTDTIPSGAYRGYGVAEANFAVEQVMDMAAARLGLSPVEIRLRNLVDDKDGAGVAACLTMLADRPASPPEAEQGDVRRGRGLAVAAKHSVTSGGSDFSSAEVALWQGPTLVLATGTCDSGTGSSRALARIVAAEFGAPVDAVLVREGDTDHISDLGSTAQRSVFLGGEAARRAAQLARAEILRVGGGGRQNLTLRWPFLLDAAGVPVVDLADLAAGRPNGSTGARTTVQAPGRGASYCALSVEVSVDLGTGTVRVESADAVVDCGTVVDALGAYGQVAGGIVQGIGLACIDRWVPGPGGGGPESMFDHGVARSLDAPRLSVRFRDERTGGRPVGLGELPMVPVAAAVANAFAAATGLRCTRTPMRPTSIWRRLHDIEDLPR